MLWPCCLVVGHVADWLWPLCWPLCWPRCLFCRLLRFGLPFVWSSGVVGVCDANWAHKRKQNKIGYQSETSLTTLCWKCLNAARGRGFVIPSAGWCFDSIQTILKVLSPPWQYWRRKWCAIPMCLVNFDAAWLSAKFMQGRSSS